MGLLDQIAQHGAVLAMEGLSGELREELQGEVAKLSTELTAMLLAARRSGTPLRLVAPEAGLLLSGHGGRKTPTR